MYPRFTVLEVQLDSNAKDVIVRLFGELPIYKAQKFEDAVKEWF